ncbi:protein NYNRIN-like [Triticum aestivum]|uniref:protein NYNRIN-like n=1 Tax=Triticum aestivum TaxID=4565 RepID=UPI001D02852A|nr:protein NYNRIN-like [Triticum aestivum]
MPVKRAETKAAKNSDDLDVDHEKDKDIPTDMDVNMVFALRAEFRAPEAEIAELVLGPKNATFEKPENHGQHLKPLFIRGHIDGKPIGRMLLDGGAGVNIMPFSGFSSADPLEEIDIGDGGIPRPTFIKANLQADQKSKLAPASMLNPIIRPWPFRGWGLDFIGEIHPSSSKRHRLVLVAIDYFTKWTEAVPLKNMTHKEVISFVLEHIIHRFGIPQTLTTDQGASFMSHQFREFAESLGIKLLNSSPYCAQTNGQAESSNKTLIKLIKKKIEEHPKRWHEVLSEALWAHRISKLEATQVASYDLVYGQEAVLPVEVNLQALRVARQNDLSAVDYNDLMMDKIDDISEERLRALQEIQKEKLRVAKAYNKKVREKSFQIGDLVWKTILPIGTKDRKFGKWSPSWEGPYKIIEIVPGNSYFVQSLQGEKLSKALNAKYLKKYYPSMWQEA